MKERPILFSAPMVRALLDGTKTQTRRVVKITHRTPGLAACLEPADPAWVRLKVAAELCPYGVPGDRLWVRETWRPHGDGPLSQCTGPENIDFRADADETHRAIFKYRASIFMPRWASRILLEIIATRVERLHNISHDDAKAEGAGGIEWNGGMDYGGDADHIGGYRQLWESINGIGSWAENPWVWVVEFRKTE